MNPIILILLGFCFVLLLDLVLSVCKSASRPMPRPPQRLPRGVADKILS